MEGEEFAPAKINLFLHVGPLAADGYHEVHSLMVFANVGDRVRADPADRMEFAVDGPFAAGLATDADNLVVRARDAFVARAPSPVAPFRLTLLKALPVAAGLGGGSSDAAATLRLLNAEWAPGLTAEDLWRIAVTLGADTPACLKGRAVLASGRGERLEAPTPFPAMDAVLANPRVASPTGAVYRAFDEAGAVGGADVPNWPGDVITAAGVAAFLGQCRNDLEAPAIGIQPAIAEVLASLRGAREALLARMSGSGATCFALCDDAGAAERLAARLSGAHPTWWVRACRLGGHPR